MKDNQNLAIGVLTITATVLLVGVLLGPLGSENAALGIGQIDRGGDYIVVTGQFTQNTELVYVTDAAAQRMNSYSFETTNRQFVQWESIDLRAIFGSVGR